MLRFVFALLLIFSTVAHAKEASLAKDFEERFGFDVWIPASLLIGAVTGYMIWRRAFTREVVASVAFVRPPDAPHGDEADHAPPPIEMPKETTLESQWQQIVARQQRAQALLSLSRNSPERLLGDTWRNHAGELAKVKGESEQQELEEALVREFTSLPCESLRVIAQQDFVFRLLLHFKKHAVFVLMNEEQLQAFAGGIFDAFPMFDKKVESTLKARLSEFTNALSHLSPDSTSEGRAPYLRKIAILSQTEIPPGTPAETIGTFYLVLMTSLNKLDQRLNDQAIIDLRKQIESRAKEYGVSLGKRSNLT